MKKPKNCGRWWVLWVDMKPELYRTKQSANGWRRYYNGGGILHIAPPEPVWVPLPKPRKARP